MNFIKAEDHHSPTNRISDPGLKLVKVRCYKSVSGNYFNNQENKMKRIMIIGSGGSGKSTFSSKLSEVLGLPLYHLDAYYWKPGWIAT